MGFNPTLYSTSQISCSVTFQIKRLKSVFMVHIFEINKIWIKTTLSGPRSRRTAERKISYRIPAQKKKFSFILFRHFSNLMNTFQQRWLRVK